MNPALLGFIRGLGTVVLTAFLAYLGDASHLNGIVSVGIAAVISSIALAIENSIAHSSGSALFGAARVRHGW